MQENDESVLLSRWGVGGGLNEPNIIQSATADKAGSTQCKSR